VVGCDDVVLAGEVVEVEEGGVVVGSEGEEGGEKVSLRNEKTGQKTRRTLPVVPSPCLANLPRPPSPPTSSTPRCYGFEGLDECTKHEDWHGKRRGQFRDLRGEDERVSIRVVQSKRG